MSHNEPTWSHPSHPVITERNLRRCCIFVIALWMAILCTWVVNTPWAEATAGVCVQTGPAPVGNTGNFLKVTLVCTCDSTDGTLPAQAIATSSGSYTGGLNGWMLYAVRTYPGGTAPTDDSDITLTNSRGTDLLGGKGTNLVDATTEKDTAPYSSTMGLYTYYPVDTILTINLSNQAVHSAIFTVDLFLTKTFNVQ